MLYRLLDAAFRREAARSMRLAPSAGVAAVPAEPVFLYVHVPFCEVLCPFCSFHRVRHREDKARTYFAALRREIALYHERGFRFSGVYVGGGTPTVTPGELAETLALLQSYGPLGDVSVETNPKDLRPEVLDVLVGAGVQRLSVGVQSFDDGLLREMDRYEKYGSSAEIRERIAYAATRFRTLNVDMIYNLPHQTEAMLEADLDVVLAGPANQVSFYPLMSSKTVERKMGRAMGLPDRRRLARYYRRVLERLRPAFTPSSAWCFNRGGHGIDEYVVSSSDYVGVGSGAFGNVGGVAYATTFSLRSYVEHVERGLTGVTGERRLGERERMRYDLMMRLFALRLERDWLRAKYGRHVELKLAPELAALRMLGAIAEDERGWQLTDRGMLVWVMMMSSFYESVNEFRAQMRAQIPAELEDDEAEVAVPIDAVGHAHHRAPVPHAAPVARIADGLPSQPAAAGANSGPLSM
jgi:coproporphyrinogen III oxidase-like Fe-S oxidoreductase